jgi:hypothetical protein
MIALHLVALVAATFFAAVALYISLVEHPARLGLADGPLLAQWQPSYKRALPIQSGLAIVGGVSGLSVWFFSSGWQWLAGSMMLLELALHADRHHAGEQAPDGDAARRSGSCKP